MNKFIILRRELYNQVWSEPLTTVAKKYQTTDYALKTICKKYLIPIPKSGHWMKLKYGKSVIIEKFEENYKGSSEISMFENKNSITNSNKELSPISQLKIEIESDKNISLKVPDRLINPDSLIVSVKDALSKLQGYSSYGNRIKAWDEINIHVTKEIMGRALRFMDTLIKAIKGRGHDVNIINRETYVLILDEKIKISCREKAKRVTVLSTSYNTTELRSTGVLTFNIDGFYPKEWKDGKTMLEEQLSVIIAKLEMEGARLKAETEERERYWAEDAKKNEILAKKIKAKEDELEKFKSFIQDARKFKEVLMLSEYLAAIIEKQKTIVEPNIELEIWIDWAQNKINWYDPLINFPDRDFEDVDKNTLTYKKCH